MFDPRVLLVVVAIAGAAYTYDHGVKPAAVKVAHVAKAGATKIAHLVTRSPKAR